MQVKYSHLTCIVTLNKISQWIQHKAKEDNLPEQLHPFFLLFLILQGAHTLFPFPRYDELVPKTTINIIV